MDLPVIKYLTAEMPGIGGRIKEQLEDFRVEEIPLYEPSGTGTHVYFRVVKAGIPTPVAIQRIARHMNVRPGEIGVAGLKDAKAVTTQMMSLEHADVGKLSGYNDSQMQVVWTGQHTNKLRPGHLKGNSFVIRIRGVGQADIEGARKILDILSQHGVPNYFGEQRFGARGDTAALGESLVRGELEEFIAIFLGRAQQDDPPDCKAARDAFDTGFYNRAMQLWPRHYNDQRRALARYKQKKKCGPALRAIDKRMKRLYVSAFQSAIFNDVLSRRIESIDRVLIGDLARKCDSGGVFTVEDPVVDQLRTDAFEISPTGPIVGYRASLASSEAGLIERNVLDAYRITQEDFRNMGPLKAKGSRRPLRFAITSPNITAGTDRVGEYLELSFAAPSGSYATIVTREITKAGA